MKQLSFSDAEFIKKKKVTRREKFLMTLEQITPWAKLVAVIEPHYPKGSRGRPPIGIERMLRMYLVQQSQGLSDEGVEDALYEIQSIRRFVGVDLSHEQAPDATTLLRFRHLLEEHKLTQQILETINSELAEKGLMMRHGTMVDATIIEAPPSTKNRDNARDPEMHQTKKGNQWHFGCKAHVGADAESGLVHTVITTAANISDVTQAGGLLHGEESVVYADAGYVGVAKREENQGRSVDWLVAEKRSVVAKLPEGQAKELVKELEHVKAKVRARVEHVFHVVKNLFHHRKTRYRGLAKNAAQLFTLFALTNLVLAKKQLLGLKGIVAP